MESNTKKYDFVLFENQEGNINHYKDVCQIALMLKQGGYNVAIADVFDEAEYCQVEGVPHISFPYHVKTKLNKGRFWQPSFIITKYQRNNYYKRIIKDLSNLTKNIYAGSYHLTLSTSWLKAVPKDVNCFFWGLRSWWMEYQKYHFFSLQTINARKLHRLFKIRKNFGLFVSEPVIKDEFIKLGISADRLIIRPERYVNSSDINVQEPSKDNLLHFVTIGSLRSDKRIEMIVDAMKELTFPFQYIIAGESRNNYEATIKSAIEGCEFVKRLNYRISDNEFKSLIQNADFLILGDKDNYSCVTNGTLMEALLSGTPVIAPDYGLYKYYVTKYDVGLLYNPLEKDSLVHALTTAEKLKKSSFEVGLKRIKKDFMFENISKQFCEDIKALV